MQNSPENIDATYRTFVRMLQEDKPWLCPLLSYKNVADMLHVPPHFLRQVFAAKGVVLADTLLRCRLDEAVRLLEKDPEIGIYDASEKAGFGCRTAFDKAFRDRFGMTPSERYGSRRQGKKPLSGRPAGRGSAASR